MSRLYLFLLFTLIACEKEPKPIVVTYQLTYRADTTFLKQYKDSIQTEMDSFCIQNYNSLYDKVKDSLLREELNKIEQLMYER